MATPEHPPRRPRATYRPTFTLSILYLFGFFVLYGLMLAGWDLFQAFQQLPPGPEQLTPEEQELARETARRALGGGKLYVCLAAAAATVFLASYLDVLPGLRRR